MASASAPSPSSFRSSAAPSASTHFAFAAVSVLFFMWGFITCMNDLLIPKLKADFSLSQFQANCVQFAFFGAYFLVSLFYFVISALRGDPINKIGYKNGLCLGLGIAGIGCLLFFPAAQAHSYPFFLGALLVLGGGVTVIQIAANPYVSILGAPETASARLNLSQGVNSLGYVIAPLIGGILLFGAGGAGGAAGGAAAVKVPYIGLAIAFFALAVILKFIPLPAFQNEEKVERGAGAFKHPNLIWGMVAIFLYVGSEVTVGSILINYLGSKEVMGLPPEQADKYLSFFWGGLMIGRLMGAVSLSNIAPSKKFGGMVVMAAFATAVIYTAATFKHKFSTGSYIDPVSVLPFLGLIVLNFVFFALGQSKAGRTVGLFAIVAGLLTVASIMSSGAVAMWSIIGIGLFNSIMWSNIFTLSIAGLGKDTSQGSSLLVMMIVGGALMPPLQGHLADIIGVRPSLAIVLLSYVYLALFGFFAHPGTRKTAHS